MENEQTTRRPKSETPKPTFVDDLLDISKVVGLTVLTGFLTGMASAAGASAWGNIKGQGSENGVIPLRRVG